MVPSPPPNRSPRDPAPPAWQVALVVGVVFAAVILSFGFGHTLRTFLQNRAQAGTESATTPQTKSGLPHRVPAAQAGDSESGGRSLPTP